VLEALVDLEYRERQSWQELWRYLVVANQVLGGET
jgi:hypothetical protein